MKSDVAAILMLAWAGYCNLTPAASVPNQRLMFWLGLLYLFIASVMALMMAYRLGRRAR